MKERIKYIRKEVGLTQVEFGEKIGVKGNTVTGYEKVLETNRRSYPFNLSRI